MNRLSLGAALALTAVALAALAAIPEPAAGCAAVPREGTYVNTAEESALIVWDEKTKTEHFVRRAAFHSTAYDFGFLVPTPSQPHLDLADDDLFRELSALTAAKIEYQTVTREVDKEFGFGCAMKTAMEATGEAMPASKADRGGVDVLEQKKLGDYDATVLRFRRGTADTPESGAAEVTNWLAKHGYEASAAIKSWLEQYVKDEWCVTAFKIGAKKTDDPHGVRGEPNTTARTRDLRAKPVRMSFKAERPFYPYREPAADPAKQAGQPGNGSRLLRVFVAAPARYAGTLGDGSKPWPGQTVWAGQVDAANWTSYFQKARLTDDVKEEGLSLTAPKASDGWWLTEFEDRSSPRPGTDEVYFAPSSDAAPVTRPPVIITNTKYVSRTPWWHAAVYLGVPVVLVIGGLATWRLLMRRAAA
jgi:hypothetical protein